MRSAQANGNGILRMSSTETTVNNAAVQIEKQNTSCSFTFFNKYYKTLFQDDLFRTTLIAIEVRVCLQTMESLANALLVTKLEYRNPSITRIIKFVFECRRS